MKVGLITKTETNPFFVKMKEGAQKAADAAGVELLTAAGKFDGDNAGQVTAIENMVAAGAKGILITPSDTKAIVPAIEKARAAGVLVIALDTPTDPQDATDALFATDNYKAGELIGAVRQGARWPASPPRSRRSTWPPASRSGVLRHNGFLKGFGVQASTRRPRPGDRAQVVCLSRHARRPGQGPDGDGELPAEGTRHQPRLHHQRARRRSAPTPRSRPRARRRTS